MAQAIDAMMTEIRKQAATTRRVLERVPEEKMSWKPHPKSMSLGQLSLHVATIPGNLCKLAQVDEFDASNASFNFPPAASTAEILTALDASVKAAQEYIGGLSEPAVMGNWRLTAHGKEVFNMSRLEMMRTILFNHWYHHRGQLSVYLRMLDVPLPSIYGPSADESPFA